ncbi:MAG: PstS family phosphate ABC transporter substrate-binding protein [Nitrosomonadaceae bacterium]|nr:PstS family phosphate ABC transporter substrate-binding protein [Nitrosomonadaceae bacterium]
MINSKNLKKYVTLVVLSIFIGAINTGTVIADTIKIDGSSTVYPITEAVAEDFQKAKKNLINVTVGISGTGGGFKKFCRNVIDIANASRPILKKEMEDCKASGVEYIEMPVAYDALTVVINPSNSWAKTMTVAELKKIWEPSAQGKIKKWNQVNPSWPDNDFKLYGAGSDSGTFDYFTDVIVGKSKSSRGDYTASEDDNVLVQGVASDKNGLGYFGYAYYVENIKKLTGVAIDAGQGGVLPSSKSVDDGSYQPLSRPIFIYVNTKAALRPEVKEFINFYMKNAAVLTAEVKYFPLPEKIYKLNLENLNKNKVGTVFGGTSKTNVNIEKIMTQTVNQ